MKAILIYIVITLFIYPYFFGLMFIDFIYKLKNGKRRDTQARS